MYRKGTDNLSLYKCCKTPRGYYLDYASCYYMPTHDMYFEYYDSPFQFIVYCSQGYVMAGLAKKVNPYTTEYRVEWIQCCRVGYGHPVAHRPPVTYMPSGVPAYRAQQGAVMAVSPAYLSQYRSTDDDLSEDDDLDAPYTNTTERLVSDGFFRSVVDTRRPDIEQILLDSRLRGGMMPLTANGSAATQTSRRRNKRKGINER